jgi:hypothetical protein
VEERLFLDGIHAKAGGQAVLGKNHAATAAAPYLARPVLSVRQKTGPGTEMAADPSIAFGGEKIRAHDAGWAANAGGTNGEGWR